MIDKKKMLAKQRIVDACPVCQGNFEGACVECLKRMVRLDRYSAANVPVGYWNKYMEDFEGNAAFKDYVINYLAQLEKNYEDGKSVCFAGGVGRGKTYAACCIVKAATDNKMDAWYDNMGLMVARMREDNLYKEFLTRISFLVIDEVDSRFLPQSQAAVDFISSSLEIVFRNRCQNLLPTIICTNEEDGDISRGFNDMFQMVFGSLRSQYIETFFVGGKDFRKQ